MATPVVTPVPSLPGLTAAQRAFAIDTGETIVVETTQQDIGDDPHNLVSQAHVAVKVRAWKVNADGTPARDAGNKVLEIPAKVETVLTSALAEGAVSLDNLMVQYTIDALTRARTWLLVKEALTRIPPSAAAAVHS